MRNLKHIRKVLSTVDYKVKQWIDDNPMDAENCEDLLNWALEEFDLNDEDEYKIEEIYRYIRENTMLPK